MNKSTYNIILRSRMKKKIILYMYVRMMFVQHILNIQINKWSRERVSSPSLCLSCRKGKRGRGRAIITSRLIGATELVIQ